jgi:hypothetical protein
VAVLTTLPSAAAAFAGRRTARVAVLALVLLLLLLLIVAFAGAGVASYLLRMMRGGGGGVAFGGLQLSSGFPSTRQHQQHQQREKKSAIAAAAAAAGEPFQAEAWPGAAAAAGRQGSASHVGDAGAAAAGPNASLLSRQVVSLPVTYDPVPATAAEGSRCFCVPWEVDSDDWWSQHGAEWNVDSTRENATHTCYVRRSGAQEQHFRRMYQVQFGSDRSNNANCTLRKMWSDGFASDLRNLMDGLVQALQSGVPFTPDATPWHYAALQDHSRPACSSDLAPTYLRGDVTPSCFFLPLSNCVNRHDIVKDRGIVNYANGRPPSFVKNGHLFQFILRPRQWVRRQVFMRSHDLRQQLLEALHDSDAEAGTAAAAGRRSSNRVLRPGCTVVHVRRGDVVLGNSRSTSRRAYRPLADYLLHVRTHTVLLLTDDADAIEESQQQQFANYTFVYWNRTRYRGSEGGWEEHLPSRDPLEEMAVLLGTFDVVPLCLALVHTASNFGQLLYALMVHGASSSRNRIPTKSGGVRRVNLDALTPQQQKQQMQQRPAQASVVR